MHTVAPAALRSVSAGGMGSFSVTIQSESALTATIDLDLENWQELPTELEDEDELFFGAMQRHNAANGSKWDLMYELLESIRHAHPKARLEQARHLHHAACSIVLPVASCCLLLPVASCCL